MLSRLLSVASLPEAALATGFGTSARHREDDSLPDEAPRGGGSADSGASSADGSGSSRGSSGVDVGADQRFGAAELVAPVPEHRHIQASARWLEEVTPKGRLERAHVVTAGAPVCRRFPSCYCSCLCSSRATCSPSWKSAGKSVALELSCTSSAPRRGLVCSARRRLPSTGSAPLSTMQTRACDAR